MRLKIEIAGGFLRHARKDGPSNQPAIIQIRVGRVRIVQHHETDELRVFRGKITDKGNDIFSFSYPPFGSTFCAVPVLPEIVKPGTVAAAAVPRSLTTPRSALPI